MLKPSSELILPPGINPNNPLQRFQETIAEINDRPNYIREKTRLHGSIFRGYSLGSAIFVTSVELAKQSYRTEGLIPAAGLVQRIAPSSMYFADPSRHSQIKRDVQPSFQASSIQTHSDYELTLKTFVADTVDGLIIDQEGNEEVQVMPALNQLTLRMMGHILGVGDDGPSTKLLQDILNGFKFPFKFSVEKSQKLISTLIKSDTISDGMFRRYFLDNKDLNFTHKELVDNFTILFLGGQSTTAHFLTMLLYNLSKYPRNAFAVYNELSGREVNAFDKNFITAYTSTNAFMYETLRMNSPFYYDIFKHPTKIVQIGGYDIPIGRELFIVLPAIMRDPKVFNSPELFLPERWINGENRKSDLMAFGYGEYHCLGRDLAIGLGRILLKDLADRGLFLVFDPDLRINRSAIHSIEPANGLPIRDIKQV